MSQLEMFICNSCATLSPDRGQHFCGICGSDRVRRIGRYSFPTCINCRKKFDRMAHNCPHCGHIFLPSRVSHVAHRHPVDSVNADCSDNEAHINLLKNAVSRWKNQYDLKCSELKEIKALLVVIVALVFIVFGIGFVVFMIGSIAIIIGRFILTFS